MSFNIKGTSRNVDDSDNDKLEQSIIGCFETNCSILQNNTNAAIGFFDNNDIEEPKGAKFPTMIVSVIGG